MRNRLFILTDVLAHKTSKRKRKSISHRYNKTNGKVNNFQNAFVLEPQNRQREPATSISRILILTQAKQHYSSQERVRKWQRKSLQSAFQIWGCGWGAGLAHPSQNEVYLCAAYAPLMRRSYQIAWAHLWDCPPALGR